MRADKWGVCVGNKGRMNDRQKAFADYYIECGNATEAARRAGYSEKTARFIGAENLTKPHILEYIRQRTTPVEQGRVASADDVMRFFTKVMSGKQEGATMSDRIAAGREILKRDVNEKKLEIELLKLEDRKAETVQEDDIDNLLLDALNHATMDVWENNDNSGADNG